MWRVDDGGESLGGCFEVGLSFLSFLCLGVWVRGRGGGHGRGWDGVWCILLIVVVGLLWRVC